MNHNWCVNLNPVKLIKTQDPFIYDFNLDEAKIAAVSLLDFFFYSNKKFKIPITATLTLTRQNQLPETCIFLLQLDPSFRQSD